MCVGCALLNKSRGIFHIQEITASCSRVHVVLNSSEVCFVLMTLLRSISIIARLLYNILSFTYLYKRARQVAVLTARAHTHTVYEIRRFARNLIVIRSLALVRNEIY